MSGALSGFVAALAPRYRVERELGAGGMATVLLAEDTKHGARVAIKVLREDVVLAAGAERFRREIELLARLRHPHVLPLLDSGEAAGRLYYVMPFVEGDSLRGRLARERQLPVAEAVRLAAQAAHALDYAHRQGIVHRDVKPENLLLVDGQATVADFGIARGTAGAGGPGATTLTQAGLVVGSGPYMSPEQAIGERALDGRSDQYALACVLYELLAGQPPFTGTTLETIVHQHLNVAPRPVTDLRPSVPPPLADAIARALAKRPADRFASCAAFAGAIEAAAAGGTATTAAGVAPAPVAAPAPARRTALPRGLAVALGLVVIAVVAWFALGRLRPAPAAASSRTPVLLAAFEAPADDPELGPVARDLVGAALDQSPALGVVPPDQVRLGLRLAALPETTRVDAALARELAARAGVPLVVSGDVARVGAAYSLRVRARGAEPDTLLLTISETARSEEDLIAAFERLGRRLREGLGERRHSVSASPSITRVITPSFEALKFYLQAREANQASNSLLALRLNEAAIALDSAFAMAWAGRGTVLGNMARDAEAVHSFERALSFPERLSVTQRHGIMAGLARLRGNPRETIAHYESALALGPPPAEALAAQHNIGIARMSLGDPAGALEAFRRAGAVGALGMSMINREAQFQCLVALDSLEAAEALTRGPDGSPLPDLLLTLAIVRREWAAAESLSRVVVAGSAGQPLRTIQPTSFLASLPAIRGRAEVGDRAMEAAQDHMASDVLAMVGEGFWIGRFTARMLRGAPAPAVPAWGASSPVLRALSAAAAGDFAAADRHAHGPSPFLSADSRAALFAVLRGMAAERREDWHGTIAALDTLGRDGSSRGFPHGQLLRQTARVLLATAWERLGEPDTAAAWYGRLLRPPGADDPSIGGLGPLYPEATLARVRLCTRTGRLDEARRAWDELERDVRDPEPPFAARMREAGAALRSAEAMRPSTR